MIKIKNFKEYQKLCKKSAKKFKDKEKEIMTWGLGIAGESGDVAGCIKKTVSHKNDQKDGIKENLGDTLWYIAMICNFFGWDLDKVVGENIEKLENRYPKGFSKKGSKRKGVDWNEK
ncbi:nucleoside triphosphate pyrophosphohydrolase family protein [Patescibacteria group bacterium]|nr:nucleoside triphosphate pyrophosphohydrolase family protein [Patescibacteria group bacterium]MBU1876902.1 nucleoside triphosphate pyrophosphohydrolase family protein [Patescibacteria group bacterium]